MMAISRWDLLAQEYTRLAHAWSLKRPDNFATRSRKTHIMLDFIAGLYPWLKTFHIFFVISWMAALLYLPRLFVYHSEAASGSDVSETFKVMEFRLSRVIMTPAMIGTWFFGLLLLALPGLVDWSSAYMWIKLLLVLGLSGYHGFLMKCLKQFAKDENTRPSKFYRIANEVPAVAMLIIVTMIVVRPF